MKSKLLRLLALICILPVFVYAQDYPQGIVQVISENNIVSGSGIITGFQGTKVYIATAYHVVKDAEQLYVRFNLAGFARPYPAQLHFEIDEDLDLAALIVSLPPDRAIIFNPYDFKQADIDRLKVKTPVMALGYPEGKVDINTFNEVKSLTFGANDVSISATGIATGFSGGAALTQNKKRLIGMIKRISGGGSSVPVLKLSTMLRYLEDWNIRTDLIRPYHPPIHPVPIGLTGLAAGKLAWGLSINQDIRELKEAEAMYRTDFRLEAETGMTHEELQQEVNDKVMQRDLIYILSGACLAGAVTFHIIRNNKKKQAMRMGLQPSPDRFFDRVTMVPSGPGIGIRVTF